LGYITLVVGLFVKSEELWEILPAIANLQLANATNHEQIATNHEQIANLQLANATNHKQIAKNKEEMEATVAMLGNMSDLVNQMAERIQILEDLHGKLKVEIV
jgi:hypothetical protein